MLSLLKYDFEPGGGRDLPSVKSRSMHDCPLPLPELELWIPATQTSSLGLRLWLEPLQPQSCQLPVPGTRGGCPGWREV